MPEKSLAPKNWLLFLYTRGGEGRYVPEMPLPTATACCSLETKWGGERLTLTIRAITWMTRMKQAVYFALILLHASCRSSAGQHVFAVLEMASGSGREAKPPEDSTHTAAAGTRQASRYSDAPQQTRAASHRTLLCRHIKAPKSLRSCVLQSCLVSPLSWHPAALWHMNTALSKPTPMASNRAVEYWRLETARKASGICLDLQYTTRHTDLSH